MFLIQIIQIVIQIVYCWLYILFTANNRLFVLLCGAVHMHQLYLYIVSKVQSFQTVYLGLLLVIGIGIQDDCLY